MHRFFVSPEHIQGPHVRFSEEQVHQIGRVLRMRPGDHVIVLDDQGWEYDVRLERLTRYEVEGRVLARRPATGEPRVRLTLYQALLKGQKFELVLQKGTELGVTAFVPLITARTVVGSLGGVRTNRWRRWQRIITEAAEQSRRGRRPTLTEALMFDQALLQAQQQNEMLLIPWEGADTEPLRRALQQQGPLPRSLGLFIGPEGGFEPTEIEQARQAGAIPVSLGPRILRSETAAIAATAAILYELGEWDGEVGPTSS